MLAWKIYLNLQLKADAAVIFNLIRVIIQLSIIVCNRKSATYVECGKKSLNISGHCR